MPGFPAQRLESVSQICRALVKRPAGSNQPDRMIDESGLVR